jgi:hypothetical protein
VLLLLCLLLSRPVLSRAAQHVAALLACAALLLAGANTTLVLVGTPSKHDLAFERQALDARGIELLARVALPGSPLACLAGGAGEIVESFCEKLLFASPEATAAAVSYVSAQMALLADYSSVWQQIGITEPAELVTLRRAIEADRFGLVAQVLASRDGCTPSRCEALALLKDASQVRANLAGRRFDSYVARFSAAWSTGAPTAVATADIPVRALEPPDTEARMSSLTPPPSVPVAIPDPSLTQSAASRPNGSLPSPGRPLRPEIFLPSAASIPAVSIMNPEPSGPVGADPDNPRTAAVLPGKGTGAGAPKNRAATIQGAAASRKPARLSEQARPSGDTNVPRSVPLTAAASQ